MRVHHQSMKACQSVIDPRAEKPGAEHQRRRDTPEAFLKIGAVLLCDMMDEIGGQLATDFRMKLIKIADHRLGHPPHVQSMARTAIRSHHRSRY